MTSTSSSCENSPKRGVRTTGALAGPAGPPGAGEAAPGVTIESAADMEDAVRRAHALAQPGDAVLLSPACASFDMFRNYEHRAQVFVAAVRALKGGT